VRGSESPRQSTAGMTFPVTVHPANGQFEATLVADLELLSIIVDADREARKARRQMARPSDQMRPVSRKRATVLWELLANWRSLGEYLGEYLFLQFPRLRT
jgi:hypothetical protein